MKKSVFTFIQLSLLLPALAVQAMAAGLSAPPPYRPVPKSASGTEAVPVATSGGATVSDSPDLRVTKDSRDWLPARPPAWQPVLPAMDEPQAVVEFDPKKRREIVGPLQPTDATDARDDHASPYEGLLPAPLSAESVIGADDRVRVGDTTGYPWRTLCKLFITAADGTRWIGSGAIIGRADGNGFHVLTAGHCVFMHDQGGWVSSIEVIPGYDDGYLPFNRAYATYFRSYTGWTASAQRDHDWAVVTLDRRIGNFTGWLGRITRASSHGIYTTTLNSGGYPGDLCGGNCQYYDSDLGQTANENRHWYWMDTAGGQSGMPIWIYSTSGTDPAPGRYITTVHAYANDGSGNSGTRLNSDKFDRIISWIDADTPPTDRADLLDDGQSYSSFSPTSVTSGSTSFSIQCRVRNIGTAASGNFRVRFYASGDTTILGTDYLIVDSSQSSLAPFSYRTVSWSGSFPTGIPAGTYYVGWIIDADGVVAEFDEGNNKSFKSSPRLTIANPVPDIRVSPTALTFAGTYAAGGETAEIPSTPVRPAAAAAVDQKLIDGGQIMQEFVQQPKARVIVNLRTPAGAQAPADFRSPDNLRAWQATVAGIQTHVASSLPAKDIALRFRYGNIPAFSAEVSWEGLQALLANPDVASIEPVYVLEAHLAQGLPLIGGATYRSQYTGSGVAIAICDTGVDYNHPRLGGGRFPNAKVLGGYDFGDGDADPAPNGHGHGTACAGIAAGELGTVGDYIGGVAPGAKIYALKISYGGGGNATSDAMAAAWDWCVTHKNDDPNYPILAISTSFGGGRHSSACDAVVPSMTAAVNNALAAGITVLASSGNNGYCDSLSWPSCISGVISVGAVYDGGFGTYTPCVDAASCAPKIATGGCASGYYASDATAADKVTSYCNAAPFLTLFAPGNRCYTLDISSGSGYSSGDYVEGFGGTSAACPYAAGAVASLQSAAKARLGRYLTAHEVKARLLATGDNITDPKTPVTKPRVNLARAIESLETGSQSIRIANDGSGLLTVNSITPQTAAPWISVTPAGPFQVAAGGYQDVAVSVNLSLAPPGDSTTRLLVASNDPDENPYPGAVQINVSRPACSYTLSPTARSHAAPAASGCVSVSAPSGCAWTASSSAGWLTIASGASGSGNGSVCYAITANPYAVTRSATLTIGGQTFTVTQAGSTPAPPNDMFANRISFGAASSQTVAGSNVGATKEPGEPDHGGDIGGKSVWWNWTAPADRYMRLTTAGSSYDTLLSVYTGSSIYGLTPVAGNDDVGGGDRSSAVTFRARAGMTYQFAVDGHDGESGSIQLNLYPLAPLHLLPPVRLPSGAWRLFIGSSDGRPLDLSRAANIEVEACSNIGERSPAWTRVYGTLTPFGGLLVIDDTGAVGQPVRFYRALERP